MRKPVSYQVSNQVYCQWNRVRNALLWLEITQSLSNRLKFSTSPSNQSPCYSVRNPSSRGDTVTVTETRIFLISKNLLGIRGWKSWNTDSLFQIYWGWNTDALFLSHCCKRVGVNKDLLTNTFTQVDHERDMINWGQNTVILSVCFVHTGIVISLNLPLDTTQWHSQQQNCQVW
jgi:hypothetical protein